MVISPFGGLCKAHSRIHGGQIQVMAYPIGQQIQLLGTVFLHGDRRCRGGIDALAAAKIGGKLLGV